VTENQVRRLNRLLVIAGVVASTLPGFGQTTLPPCVVPQTAAKTAANDAPQFYDEPQFTVAGVKDPSETGGHGSDTVRRTTEAMTKETVSLGVDGVKDVVNDPKVNDRTVKDESVKDEAALRANLAREPKNASWHHALADLEEKKGNSLAAVQEYQKAADLAPSETNLFDWGAELLLHRAYEPASEVFAKGKRLFPASVRMAMGLGVAAYALGSYELAAQRFCEASDVDPSDPNPYLFLGKLQAVGSGLLPGVVERLERFERVRPGNAWATYYHAVAVWKRREASGSAIQSSEIQSSAAQVEELLRKAVANDPKLAVGYLQLGIVYSEEKDWPKAIAALENAVKIDPDLEEGHFRLAKAYRMAGQTDKAKVELQVYQRIAKQHDNQAEHSRREVAQFVYSSRSAKSAADKR
jgi:tetratricopeptide (TPR) repeat protein